MTKKPPRSEKKKPLAKPPRVPPSRLPAVRSVLTLRGLAFEEGATAHDPWTVGGFLLWPQSGYWRARDGSRQGYTIADLVRADADAKAGIQAPAQPRTVRERSEALATGYAAVAAAFDPLTAPPQSDCQGEHAGGPAS